MPQNEPEECEEFPEIEQVDKPYGVPAPERDTTPVIRGKFPKPSEPDQGN